MNSTVTAIIPTRNRHKVICRAVQSVLNQTYKSLEVIVVVDGPDLPTVNMLRNLQEPRLQIIALEQNVGVSEARNIGVCHARGEWIALLDDDDEWLPDKVAKQIALLANVASDTNFVACRCQEADTSSCRLSPARFPHEDENWSESICCDNNLFLLQSWLIKKELLLVAPFDKGVCLCEDIMWLLRVRTANLIVPVWLDDVLVIVHNDCDDATRLSRASDWRGIYSWALENRGTLLTRKAFAYWVLRFCFLSAKRSGTPIRDSSFLLTSALLLGRVDFRFCMHFALYAGLTASARNRFRGHYERLTFWLKKTRFKRRSLASSC